MLNEAVYVYYKVRAGAEAELLTRVRAMQAALQNTLHSTLEITLETELARRRDDPSTWMEVYRAASGAALPENFTSMLQQAVLQHGLEPLLDPALPRITEIFVAL
jgi:hypothetical protein